MKLLALAFLIDMTCGLSVLYPSYFWKEVGEGKSRVERNAIPRDEQRWPDGIIPYEIDYKFMKKSVIEKAIDHIEERTCIRFIARRPKDKDYIRIVGGGNVCHSLVGRVGGPQDVRLGRGCTLLPTVIHELMHAIGFAHEHQRADRDDYLTILTDNINDKFKGSFSKMKEGEGRLLTPFDYNSIMLYGSGTFSKTGSETVMLGKDEMPLKSVIFKGRMSEGDIKRVNMLYDCN